MHEDARSATDATDPEETVVVVGTAGHVDHGKSTLVRALTDTDPDRLDEEKARGLTIDLGFATTHLPSGRVASFVDVPGHEDFIRNALAGVGGIDAALFVVAADEGPMPQTLEHLAILDLLGVRHGVVALTKTDLAEEDWAELVCEDVRERIDATSLAGAPIVPVSAVADEGLDALVDALDDVLARVPSARDVGRPRLSVDRVFTIAGFGTVVTGTLRDGPLRPGDELRILPGGQEARARGVQSHGRDVERAPPGTRVAVNLSGVDVEDVARGDVVVHPDQWNPTRLIDLHVRVIPDAPGPLEHDRQLAVFHGAAEILGRARLIGAEQIEPGEEGWVQMHLARPAVLSAGDRVVLRLPSPSRTMGGARVLDPRPPHRWRRFDPDVEQRFAALASRVPEEIAWHALDVREPCSASAIHPADVGLEREALDAALSALRDDDRARTLADGMHWITRAGWDRLAERLRKILAAYHASYPLRWGPPAEELRQRLHMDSDPFAAVLDTARADGWLERHGARPHLATHAVAFDEATERRIEELLTRFRDAPYTPPAASEARSALGDEVLDALLARGTLVAVTPDVLFDEKAYETMRSWVVEQLAAGRPLEVTDLRDHFDTSRKYALGLLEHLDRIHVTRRVGDRRVLVREPADGE